MRFLTFLQEFEEQGYTYTDQLESMTLRPGGCTLFVDYAHLSSYDYELSEALSLEYYRFEPSLTKALSSFIKTSAPAFHAQAVKDGTHFAASLYNLPEVLAVRALRTERVGHIVSVVGTVTRSSDVRPEVRYNGMYQRALLVQPECGFSTCHFRRYKWKYQHSSLVQSECAFLACSPMTGLNSLDNRRRSYISNIVVASLLTQHSSSPPASGAEAVAPPLPPSRSSSSTPPQPSARIRAVKTGATSSCSPRIRPLRTGRG